MTDTLIKVEGLYKKFTRSLRRSMAYGTVDTMRSMLGISYNAAKLRNGEFWALQDINFELKRGETLGLIGQNGCGKSTLLRLLNGIFPPDAGRITINGRIGALIAVGAGFHPQMSGRENIYLNGTILGMTRQEIKRKFDEIIDFAEIGDFLDAPVATYSSGMTVRLGFAIAIHCEPDILLVDEILAVGDKNFQIKCYQQIHKLKNKGVSIILVAHNEYTIIENTKKTIYLKNGTIKMYGDTVETVNLYINTLLIEKNNKNLPLKNNTKAQKAEILSLEFDKTQICFGNELTAKIKLNVNEEIICPIIGLNFYSDYQIFACINNQYSGPQIDKFNGNKEIIINIRNLNMPAGNYRCSVTISEENNQNLIDWKENIENITIIKDGLYRGDIKLNASWEIY